MQRLVRSANGRRNYKKPRIGLTGMLFTIREWNGVRLSSRLALHNHAIAIAKQLTQLRNETYDLTETSSACQEVYGKNHRRQWLNPSDMVR